MESQQVHRILDASGLKCPQPVLKLSVLSPDMKAGEILAEDQHGAIRAKDDGLILMPLYQRKGTEGFFLVKNKSERF